MSRSLLLGCFVAVTMASVALASGATEHRWTLRDGIEMSVFLRPDRNGQLPRVRFSPDGAHFIVATLRGDLASGKRIATIWLFDSQAVDRYLKSEGARAFKAAQPLLQSGSASNREPISDWRWSADSRSVLYLAADDDGARRLYRASIDGGAPVALSRPGQDVSRFDECDGAVVYLAHPAIMADELYQAGGPSLPDIVDATGKNNLPLMFPNWVDYEFQSGTDELWLVQGGHSGTVLSTDRKAPIHLKNSRLLLSPDGHSVLVTTYVHRIPKTWERYKRLINYPGIQIVADTPETVGSTGYLRPRQYSLVDLANGSISLLADSPIGLDAVFNDAVTAAWSADGMHIALPGAYPPLADAPSTGPIYPCTIAVVEVKSKAFACLQPRTPFDPFKHPYSSRKQLLALKWLRDGSELVAQFATPGAPNRKTQTVYAKGNDGKWGIKSSGPVRTAQVPAVRVQQALNKPPVLVASDTVGHSRTLLDPNPQLKDIALGTTARYHWTDAEGNRWTGVLVKPPDFETGHRYPLVIQTHGLANNEFFVSGPSASGFAARALAAHDMVVLQVFPHIKDEGTPKESEEGAAGYRAAIRQLTRQGMINPHKVGIIAWSHTGPYVYQAMIDQPGLYRAATLTETNSNSYPEYLQNIDYMGTDREKMARAQIGGEKPFGNGLKSWVKNSPGFHLDRICTPILMEFNSPVGLQWGWDDYAALRADGKPVDLLYIRNGDHDLVKPLERLAEQGRNVDWYDYWLNGHKDPDPAKAAQYRLWDHMKATLPVCRKARIPAL